MEEYVGGFYRPRQEVVHPLVLMFSWREISHLSSFFPTTIRKSGNEDLLVCPKNGGKAFVGRSASSLYCRAFSLSWCLGWLLIQCKGGLRA